MVNELKLPELGENIEAVDVSAVLVAKGDQVRRDQPVIEVETEKASLEVPSTFDGRVAELRVAQGDKVSVGQVILVVESDAEPPPDPGPQLAPAAAPEAPAAAGAPSVAAAGPVPDRGASVVAFPARAQPAQPPTIGKTAPAAPSVRALARELGIDVAQVPGSGPGGRISRDDVKAFAKRLIGGLPSDAGRGPEPAPALPDFTHWGEIERQPLSTLRRKTAEAMATAWARVPHVTQFDEADITSLETQRKSVNARPEMAQSKLSLTALVVKVAAACLRRFPRFNASLDLAADALILKKYVHIGVAVDTDRGLLVPVVRDADRKKLLQVSVELNDLAARARGKKVKPDELHGASFTVTNLGGLGTTHFSPIVNWPEVAILGIGRARFQVVPEQGQLHTRLILPLSLSFDHRLIDGADAARFLRWMAEALEQPLLLLLEEKD